MQHIHNYPNYVIASTPNWIVHSEHDGFGLKAVTETITRLAVAGSGWAIPMPIRKPPDERVKGLLVHPRTTCSSPWSGILRVYGVPPNLEGAAGDHQTDWFGPIDVLAMHSSPTVSPATTKTVAGSLWYCGQSVYVNGRGMAKIALLPTVQSTPSNWSAKSGLKVDVDVLDDTAG